MLLKGLKISDSKSNESDQDKNLEDKNNQNKINPLSNKIQSNIDSSDSNSEKLTKNKKNSKQKKSKKSKEKKNLDFNEILLKEKIKLAKKEEIKNSIQDINTIITNETPENLLNKKRHLNSNTEKQEEKIEINPLENKMNFPHKNKFEKISENNNKNFATYNLLIDNLFTLFKEGKNEEFKIFYKNLENFQKSKENFFKILPKEGINEYSEEDDNSVDSYSSKNENLNNFNLDNDATNLYAYDKDKQYLNSDINFKLKKDLFLMNKYDNFEKGLNMNKELINYTNNIEKKLYDTNNKDEKINKQEGNVQKSNKQEQKILDSLDKKLQKQEKIKLNVLSSCSKCYGAKLNLDSVFSQSSKVYLSYPYYTGSITNHHFVLATKEHINSFAGVEEDLCVEIRNYMKSIVAFNLSKNFATVFIEFSQHVNNHQHMEIECIPIKSKLLEDAKLYFKKAFMEQDYEWTTNKKLIDTTPHRGNLTKYLNSNFSYVHVDFNAQGGFLHIIEDVSKFSQVFLKEIFCPLLKKESFEIKYPDKISPKELFDIIDKYKDEFGYYDWTKY